MNAAATFGQGRVCDEQRFSTFSWQLSQVCQEPCGNFSLVLVVGVLWPSSPVMLSSMSLKHLTRPRGVCSRSEWVCFVHRMSYLGHRCGWNWRPGNKLPPGLRLWFRNQPVLPEPRHFIKRGPLERGLPTENFVPGGGRILIILHFPSSQK